jgi:hypothetical protein
MCGATPPLPKTPSWRDAQFKRSTGTTFYGLDDRGPGVRFPAGAGNFSLHRVQTGSGAHPASYPMGNRGFFLGVKRPGRETYHSPPSSAEVKECVELYLHSPSTPSWLGAQLKHRDNFTFTFTYNLFLASRFFENFEGISHFPSTRYMSGQFHASNFERSCNMWQT